MYKKMYCLLFNTITDALRELDAENYGRAAELLRKGQCDAEEIYISCDGGEDACETEEP